MCLRVRCWLPFGRCVLPSSRCVNRAVSFVERRCNSGSLPLGCPSPPLGCPRAGSGRTARRGAVPSESSRDDVAAPTTLPMGASTGALCSAVVDAVPGDLQGPRAGAHGCAKFLSLVCLSSKACSWTTSLLPADNCDTRHPSNISSARTLCKTAPPLTRFALSNQPECCQLCCQPSRHCSQRWTYEQSKT